MPERWEWEREPPALTLEEWAEAVGYEVESREYDDRDVPEVRAPRRMGSSPDG
jgi:hypothetical protein